MSTVACPHCSISNAIEATFCGSCGKAMPMQAASSPRVIKGSDLATSSAGQDLQSDELVKKMKTARTTLLVIGVLQLILGGVLTAVYINATGDERGMAMVGIVVGVIGLLFAGLGVWATWAPFPAALTGLVLYVSLMLLDVVTDPSQILRGIIIKIIIIAALVKAVQAGIQYRQLRRQMQQAV